MFDFLKGDAGGWILGAAVLASFIVGWMLGKARSRTDERPKQEILEDLNCEPGQKVGLALAGGVAKLFSTGDASFGSDPSKVKLTLVCNESSKHSIEIEALRSPWSEEAVIVFYPEQGPCGRVSESDALHYRIEARLADGVHSTGPLYILHPDRDGYPGFAKVPIAPAKPTHKPSEETVTLPLEAPSN